MLIIDAYSMFITSSIFTKDHPLIETLEYTSEEILDWQENIASEMMQETALCYLNGVHELVKKIEEFFGATLLGELILIPSMGELDGFARFDRGSHKVLLGVDFPNASLAYLKALTAHELSHVFRDHSPQVWQFTGRPLTQITRDEYLAATTGREHLISEGLATLTSQAIFPEIALQDHHYYEPEEMKWCLDHYSKIDQALTNCLSSLEPDPWKFYSPGLIMKGSPSRTHYYWAAQKIHTWIKYTPGMSLVQAHKLPSHELKAF